MPEPTKPPSDLIPPRPRKPDFTQARVALIFVVFLQVVLHEGMQAGAGLVSQWAIPGAEVLLLLVLSSLTLWRQRRRQRNLESVDAYITRHGGGSRVLAFALIGTITATNIISLLRLVNALLHANKATGLMLLDDAANLWVTNVVCFALWYWELDRGGPSRRGLPDERNPDFLFANMQAKEFCKTTWLPGFVDYLFLSFTNATAFSPTDALPLTRGAKGVMMIQASVSLLTLALVAARAVNILS